MSFGGARDRGGYGDFGGMGGFNNFGDESNIMDDSPQPLSAMVNNTGSGGGGGRGRGRNGGSSLGASLGASMGLSRFGGGGGGSDTIGFQQDMMWLKQDNQQIKNAVILLEKDRDNLRHAIRKLKVENSRMKLKMKRMAESVKAKLGDFTMGDSSTEVSDLLTEMDYDDIGRNFILVGGPQDPFSLRYEATIRDMNGLEHRSAERYYWYKMAETFGDDEVMDKIQAAANTLKAEEAMKEIKGFDEAVWDAQKMKVWEDGQRLKMDQVRWIQNLLVYTDNCYIAVASQDKTFGTGWRKNRDEAGKPLFWDGENGGGKALMRLRDQYRSAHAWAGPYEEQETEKKYTELKRNFWRRGDPNRFTLGNTRGGSRGGGYSVDYSGGISNRRGGLGFRGRGGNTGGFPTRRTY